MRHASTAYTPQQKNLRLPRRLPAAARAVQGGVGPPWAELNRFDAKDDKALIARIAVMYTVVTAVNLVSSSERRKRQEAVERERALQRERVELSRTIHDTVAQSVYVVGLGIETSRDLARKTVTNWRRTRGETGRDLHSVQDGPVGAEASHRLGAHVKGGAILYRRGGGERWRVALENRTTRLLMFSEKVRSNWPA